MGALQHSNELLVTGMSEIHVRALDELSLSFVDNVANVELSVDLLALFCRFLARLLVLINVHWEEVAGERFLILIARYYESPALDLVDPSFVASLFKVTPHMTRVRPERLH